MHVSFVGNYSFNGENETLPMKEFPLNLNLSYSHVISEKSNNVKNLLFAFALHPSNIRRVFMIVEI